MKAINSVSQVFVNLVGIGVFWQFPRGQSTGASIRSQLVQEGKQKMKTLPTCHCAVHRPKPGPSIKDTHLKEQKETTISTKSEQPKNGGLFHILIAQFSLLNHRVEILG